MKEDITARERRLEVMAAPAEHTFTIEVRLLCPVDNRHHVGTLHTNSGSNWTLRDLRPSVISRDVERDREPDERREPVESIFEFLDDRAAEPAISAPKQRMQEQVLAQSVLKWERTPHGNPRLRWNCCHCRMDRRRLARPDNVLRGDRLAWLVKQMREHGPSRLKAELSPTGLETAVSEVLRHAEAVAPDRP